MRDHVTEERISAYVDGELEGDELKLVEDLLAESAEHRQLLAELQMLRASIRALPSFNLPVDFYTRVVSQIDRLAVSPTKEPARRAGSESKARPWRSVFLAAATLAAVVAVTVMLRPPTPTPNIPERPGIGTTQVAMPAFLERYPKYVMVYDVTVTPAGQKNKTVEKLLQKLGIGIDPALRLDGKLENQLMVIRESQQLLGATEATRYKTDQVTPKSTDKDKVEMIYVASTIGVLDQFGMDLAQMSIVGEQVCQLHYDMAIEPNKLGVMHRLHDSAREHFALRTNVAPSDIGLAFRIDFRIELTSVSVPGVATFPMPMVRAESTSPDGSRELAPLDVNGDGAITPADARGVMSQLNQHDGDGERNAGDGLDEAGLPIKGATDPGHILLIIRNVGAYAAANR